MWIGCGVVCACLYVSLHIHFSLNQEKAISLLCEWRRRSFRVAPNCVETVKTRQQERRWCDHEYKPLLLLLLLKKWFFFHVIVAVAMICGVCDVMIWMTVYNYFLYFFLCCLPGMRSLYKLVEEEDGITDIRIMANYFTVLQSSVRWLWQRQRW